MRRDFVPIRLNGGRSHCVELATDIGTQDQYDELARVAQPMLDEWSETKKAPQHAAWLHEIARAEHGIDS